MADIIGHVFAPLPILTVVLGAGIIALLQTGTDTAGKAFAALGPLFAARPDDDRDAARALLFKVEAIAELKGLAHTDRLRAAHPFCRQALVTLANSADAEHFAAWIGQAVDDRRERHGRVIAFWNALADAAPAMGMAGTIIGLIGMFASMRDPGSIGPSMALALMTTLHGMILANVIAGPIANRLHGVSERELAWQRSFAERVTAIARREPAMLRRSIVQEVA
jgi:chemotaxis protein MotA